MDTNERLSRYLDYLESNMKDATEFAKEQAPLVVQEFLTWEVYQGIIYGTLVLLTITTIAILLHKAFKTLTREQVILTDNEENICFVQILTAAVLGAILVLTVPCVMRGLKAYVAPRVVVLEQVKQWVR